MASGHNIVSVSQLARIAKLYKSTRGARTTLRHIARACTKFQMIAVAFFAGVVLSIFMSIDVVDGSLVAPTYYNATWESLDQRPVHTWFEDAKFGIFLHWGVYSVPAYHGKETKGLGGRYAGMVSI